MTASPIPWSTAWREAHLGVNGFYRRHAPARHFATEAQSGPLAEALGVLIAQVAAGIPSGEPCDVVDIGAGSGELLTSLLALHGDDPRLRFTGIDVRPRPGGVPDRIDWITGEAPQALHRARPEGVAGIVLAHEWLDDVPLDVVGRDDRGVVRHVLVDPSTGAEIWGDAVVPGSDTQSWLDAWWGPVVDRAEVGLSRDAAWTSVCAAVRVGMALAIDYGHTREQRDRFSAGSIIGYRDGAAHWPIPDGSMNITAHVAWDSLIAVTTPPGRRRDQAEMYARLLPTVDLPPPTLATSDPHDYAERLQRHTRWSRARDRSTGVSWLIVDIPPHAPAPR